MLEESTHIFYERLAIYVGIILVLDGIWRLTKSTDKSMINRKLAWLEIGIGISTIIIDNMFLKSFGVNLW